MTAGTNSTVFHNNDAISSHRATIPQSASRLTSVQEEKSASRVKSSLRDESDQTMKHAEQPTTDLNAGIVGWESQDDPELPYNFSVWQKWTWVWLLSAITLLTPFATSILSPAINIVDKEFDNPDAYVGSLTVSIYLFGYVVGPIFIGPLSEVYGRKPILSAANSFFCLWQLGCALAPNLAILIVARFFSGVGGAACLVRALWDD
jgi:Na+/melibiose symporter-like transporter